MHSMVIQRSENVSLVSLNRVHFKLSLAGEDTGQGRPPWSVSPPTTVARPKQQFEMHPIKFTVLKSIV